MAASPFSPRIHTESAKSDFVNGLLTATTGGINLGGNVTASGNTVTLTTEANIFQSSGIITAGTLSGSSVGGALFPAATLSARSRRLPIPAAVISA